MKSNWRKQMMISALALTLSATNVAPVFASAAPDGKTNAVDIAQTMGTTAQWNRWEKEWETLKNDWTQISLSPGSNAILHGIHQSRQMMIIQMQMFQN